MVLSNGSTTSGVSQAAGLDDSDEYACPICEEEVKGLVNLNSHLDDVHQLGMKKAEDREGRPSKLPNGTKKHAKIDRHLRRQIDMKKDHWIRPIKGSSRCEFCHQILNQENGIINCRKCGLLFCRAHCKQPVKLDRMAHYDPIRGEPCKCCLKCLENRPGYNEFGFIRDRTAVFSKARKSNNEDRDLRELQLEHRFIRLVNGIVYVYRVFEGTFMASLRISAEISKLEKSIVPWERDEFAIRCYICETAFAITVRKHHCRLCGKVVCDNEINNCSNLLPLKNLINAAADLPLKITAQTGADVLDIEIRICAVCLQSLFKKRKFLKERVTPLSALLQKYESLHDISRVIMGILPNVERVLDRAGGIDATPDEISQLSKLRRKLLDSFSMYDFMTKQILQMQASNASEARIIASIKLSSATFIQDKMLPLKSISSVISSKLNTQERTSPQASEQLKFDNDLTIKEVKSCRTQLMVLKEQRFLVQEMIEDATKRRKLDEASTLTSNVNEIDVQIEELTKKLGQQGFK
ncbi:LAMI_0C04456g1_1 [Lachancea mirantina]|uniref:LAMI_0C04456g1_1 n=1 Tax=Lachancea mirantina TaxID=1230905 RepID=A0A1G4J244_9SACH|nr:LAMI_0C04456g1_1 [Lachancea mirantina]